MFLIVVFILFLVLSHSHQSHFRGGSISWKPVNPNISFPVSSVSVYITTRLCYIYNRFSCNTASDIGTLMGDATPNIISTSGPIWFISAQTYCDSFDATESWQCGLRTQTATITTSQQVTGTYKSSAWVSGIISLTNSATWIMDFSIDVRQRNDTYKVNSAPYTTSLSYMQLSANCPMNQSVALDVHDPDGDEVKCRCSTNVCISNLQIDEENCIFYFNPTATGYYAIEIVIEDFGSSGSNVPLSSVPFQFLANVFLSQIYCCN